MGDLGDLQVAVVQVVEGGDTMVTIAELPTQDIMVQGQEQPQKQLLSVLRCQHQGRL